MCILNLDAITSNANIAPKVLSVLRARIWAGSSLFYKELLSSTARWNLDICLFEDITFKI